MGMPTSGKPFLGAARLKACVVTRRCTTAVRGVNRGGGQGELIVLNSFFGESARTNGWGIEATVRLLAPCA